MIFQAKVVLLNWAPSPISLDEKTQRLNKMAPKLPQTLEEMAMQTYPHSRERASEHETRWRQRQWHSTLKRPDLNRNRLGFLYPLFICSDFFILTEVSTFAFKNVLCLGQMLLNVQCMNITSCSCFTSAAAVCLGVV